MLNWLHPSLIYTWLLPLACLPILIHLINLIRHRRVKWAAMSFLLESQKRNRNWIRLKQLLLLICRVTAVAAIVAMLAGPLLSDHWSRLFSGGHVHHVVLLDDSMSMADRWEDRNAFDAAQGVVQHLIERASWQSTPQSVTLLSFTEAASGTSPAVLRMPIRPDTLQPLSQSHQRVVAAEQSAGPLTALEAVEKQIGRQSDETTVVYLVSDFRSEQWHDTGPLKEQIEQLAEQEIAVELVRCVENDHPNLAVTELRPAAGIRAAGVPLKMDLEVTNYSTQAVENVLVLIECQTNSVDASSPGVRHVLPAVTLERIEPGRSARQSFEVTFPTAGDHEILARLPNDSLSQDNERYCVVQLPADVSVLIVDGQSGSLDAAMLRLALAPNKQVRTGIRPLIASVDYLRDQPLEMFSTIYLMNVDRLEAAAVEALDKFVADGGGLVVCTGDPTQADFINESFYRNGEGFFPLPLVSPASLHVDRIEKSPDLVVDLSHPIFARTFAGSRNNFLPLVQIQRYYATEPDWAPTEGSETRVAARLRGGAPLLVERRYGRGMCLALLTTIAPHWNNLGRGSPILVIALLEMQAYILDNQTEERLSQVGQPLTVEFAKDEYQSEVQFEIPESKSTRRVSVQAQPAAEGGKMVATLTQVPVCGVYTAQLTRADGVQERHHFGVNVPGGESALELISKSELQTALAGTGANIHDASAFSGPVTQQAGVNLGAHWLVFLALIVLLAAEQLLAYSASYHPARAGAGRR